MKKVVILVLACVFIAGGLAGAVSCGTSAAPVSSTPPNTTGTTAAVTIKDLAFSPDMVTVAIGTTVTWTNQDSVSHTITSVDGIFGSDTLAPGNSFSFTFIDKGTFDYFCSIHPHMTGSVIVQ